MKGNLIFKVGVATALAILSISLPAAATPTIHDQIEDSERRKARSNLATANTDTAPVAAGTRAVLPTLKRRAQRSDTPWGPK